MQFLELHGKEIVALLVPFIAWILNAFFKARAKLQVATPHQFNFIIQQPLIDKDGKQIAPTQIVRTSSLVVNNAGRDTASKIELVFNWKPMCLNLWPVRHYSEHVQADGRYVLIFDSLAPNEFVGCEILAVNGELPNLITVRCDQCVAQNVAMTPQLTVSNWVRITAGFLAALGMAAAVYLIIVLLQFLVLRTPFGH